MVNTVSVEQGRTAGARQGIVLLLASVMPIMAIISLVPVLPLLLEEFGDVAGAEVLVPIALTIPALCVALLSPVAGWLADRVGRCYMPASASSRGFWTI